MNIKFHPYDLESLVELYEQKNKICCMVDAGSLKLGDIEIQWSKKKDMITIKGKDILI